MFGPESAANGIISILISQVNSADFPTSLQKIISCLGIVFEEICMSLEASFCLTFAWVLGIPWRWNEREEEERKEKKTEKGFVDRVH